MHWASIRTAAAAAVCLFQPGAGALAQPRLAPPYDVRPAGQAEITQSPQTVTIRGATASDLELGVLAVDRLAAPALNGRQLMGVMPTGASLVLRTWGTAAFSYTDNFQRHFRGRTQAAEPGEEFENLLALPADHPKPKVLLDAYRLPSEILALHTRGDALGWNGDLIYKFDFGMPVREFRLATAGGKTLIHDTGGGVEISLSSDGETWSQVWSSPGGKDNVEVEASLPEALKGARTIWLRLRAVEAILAALHVSAKLDAKALAPVFCPDGGEMQVVFSDAPESSHRAVVFWRGRGVETSGGAAGAPSYPEDRPSVTETQERITIAFPAKVAVSLRRSSEGGIAGFDGLWIGDEEILAGPAPAPELEVLSPGESGATVDWKAYLQERKQAGYVWPRRGGREIRKVSLEKAAYLGSAAGSDEASIRLQVAEGGETGEMTWTFTPVEKMLGGRTYVGLSWKVRLSGLERAAWLRVTEPVRLRYGDWSLQQTWGRWYEQQIDFLSEQAIPSKWYFGDAQPYYFAGGLRGAVVSYFDRVVGAEVAVNQDGDRHVLELRIPLGTGSQRESPAKLWLWTGVEFPSKWAAVDEWTRLCDALGDMYRKQMGVGRTEPRPLLWHSYLDSGFDPGNQSPPLGASVFYQVAQTHLYTAKQGRFAAFMLDGPWDADAHHPPEKYLDGSRSFGSNNAPWSMKVSPALGGEEGFRYLSQKARDLGIDLLLWVTPGHLSNSSPLLVENPDWIRWKISGVPEDADYGDIVGVRMDSGWFSYAVGEMQRLNQTAPFAGFLVDSWLTFGVYPDGRARQPVPSLVRSIEMQKAWREMELNQIYIEGVSPFGISGGGFGWEGSFFGGGAEEAWAAFEKIEGREYGLYRYAADTMIRGDSYYRTLASKGIVSIFSLSLTEQWSDSQVDMIVQTNRDYMRVLPWMQHRHLVGRGDEWLGVAWTKDGSDDIVLFSFKRFPYPVSGDATVEDVTAEGRPFEIHGGFYTEPRHTYVIRRK